MKRTGETLAIIRIYVCLFTPSWGWSFSPHLPGRIPPVQSQLCQTHLVSTTNSRCLASSTSTTRCCVCPWISHTRTHARVASCSICQPTSAASSFIKAGNKSVLWCERRKVFIDLETEDKTALWRTEDIQRAGLRRYLFSSSLRVSVYVSPVCVCTRRHLSVPGFINPTAPSYRPVYSE